MTDQPTREAIAPCPAGHPYVRTNRTFTNLGERWYANCVDCAWQGPLAATEPAAIFIWNTRALSTPIGEPAVEPFGYWVEQRHAEPCLLRRPAYIPEPNERRTVTPLYAAPATPQPAIDQAVADERETLIGRMAYFCQCIAHADREGWNDATIDEARAIDRLIRATPEASWPWRVVWTGKL